MTDILIKEHGAEHGAPHGAPGHRQAPAAPSAPCPPMKSGGHGGVWPARMRAKPPGHGAQHGAERGAPRGADRSTRKDIEIATNDLAFAEARPPLFADAKALELRLEEAGETLLLLPQRGYTTRLRTSTWNVLDEATEAYATQPARLHLPVPSAAKITRMDEALSWLPLIPDDKYVLRRLVASRMLVSPLTGRHLFPWRRLATLLGADHKAIQRWHGQGIDLLLTAVNRRK
jgi:hypothetical protein